MSRSINVITEDRASGAQVIDGSLKFDDNYLTRTPGSEGNLKSWTWSAWVKPDRVSGNLQNIFEAKSNGTNYDAIYFTSGQALEYELYRSSQQAVKITNRIFRDTGWYHLVVVYDAENSTADDRVRIYVNGERETSFSSSTNPDTTDNSFVNDNSIVHQIGDGQASNQEYDGRLSQVYLIDGQALDASYFGFTDGLTNTWRPKKYEGTFGTNGFWLPFDGNSPIGKDKSGNGNDWTPVNFGGSNSIEKATGGLPILNTMSGGNVAIPGTRTDEYASNIVMAIPFLGNANDISADIKGSGSNLSVTTSGSPVADTDPTQWYGSSFNVSTSNYIDTIGTTSTFAFLHQPEAAGTVEGWINTNAINNQGPWFQTSNGTDQVGVMFRQNSSTNLAVQINRGVSGQAIVIDSSIAIAHGVWYHWAFVKSANGYAQFFLNGVPTGDKVPISTAAGASNAASTSSTSSYAGRIAKNNGESRGVGANICDYRAYTIQKYAFDTPFIPASINPDILPDTPSGVSGSSKLTKITDGAVAFDGTDHYLQFDGSAGSNPIDFGTGDFTVEAFVYHQGGTDDTIISDASGWTFTYGAGGDLRFYMANGSNLVDANTNFLSNQWVHVAVVRNSGTLVFYQNGTGVGSHSYSHDISANGSATQIGKYHSGTVQNWEGFISNLRVVQGTALYTSDFTPPTAPLTNVTNTKLLCCQDTNEFRNGAQPILNTNATGTTTTSGTRVDPFASSLVLALPFNGSNGGTTFTDQHATIKGSGSAKTISRNGNTQTSTAQSQYYGSSALFDGSGDNLTIPASSDFDFGTGAYTVEMWIKTSADAGWLWHDAQSVDQGLRVCVGNNGSNSSNAGKLEFNEQVSNGDVYTQSTSRVDDGNWHHFAICRSSSGGTRLYVDGIHEATGNSGRNFDNNNTVYIGMRASGSGSAFNGYIQDLRVYKGIAKYTSNFNVTAPSVEPPAAVSPSSIVAASAAVTNFNPFNTDINTVRGQETRYCTLNPLEFGNAVMGANRNADVTFSDGNLTSTVGSTNNREVVGNTVVSSGKYYFEAMFDPGGSSDNSDGAGWVADSGLGVDNSTTGGFCMLARDNGSTVIGNSNGSRADETSGTHASFNRGDVMGCAIDLDSRIATWYKNGVKYTFAVNFSSRTNLDGQNFKPMVLNRLAGSVFVNFGQKPFKFPPPEGYTILSAPTVRPETVISNPEIYFKPLIYDAAGGQGGSRHIDAGLEADFIWIKNRNNVKWHILVNGVIGYNKFISSNSNMALSTEAHVTNVHKTGYTVNDIDSGTVNEPGLTYVAWNWKAGGHSSNYNIDGAGYATASAAGLSCTADLQGASIGTKQGFSIIQYQATSGETVAHGLSQQPDFMMIKNYDTQNDWMVYHKNGNGSGGDMSNSQGLNLNNDDGTFTSGSNTFITGKSATTFTVGSSAIVQNGSDDYCAFVWHDVPGLQKFGYYEGNNSSDGVYVELGFKPALLIIKRTDADGYYWTLFDNVRRTFNVNNHTLNPESNRAEETSGGNGEVDFLSSGFKCRDTDGGINGDGGDYIYMAWAEAPEFNMYGAHSNAR